MLRFCVISWVIENIHQFVNSEFHQFYWERRSFPWPLVFDNLIFNYYGFRLYCKMGNGLGPLLLDRAVMIEIEGGNDAIVVEQQRMGSLQGQEGKRSGRV